MDKNKIKSFAVWARKDLIAKVCDRARYIGLYIDDNGDFKEVKAVNVQGGFKLEGKEEMFPFSKLHRDKLVNEIREKGFEQVMEEVAYTWFNRFMGLRYMEVNEYLPSGIRILSSELEGKTEPDALTKIYNLIDDLTLDINKVNKLLSDTDDNGNEKEPIQKQNDIRDLYKYILVKQCNELGKIIPQMFEKITDYTELLLPDNLLEEGSVIRKMVEDIVEEDWKEEVEIIGWMYQYYISEKKDEVFAALKKNVKITKENIPAATQLFTPKWIVKYMVENSLGRLWLEGHPNEELQKEWKYYLEEAQQEPEVEEELNKIREEHSQLKPEDIKVLDPCMGSGHILVYAFDILYEIYKTAGYSEREIPRMILQNNLYGLDIDDRAAQLASFALIMKARHYNRRLFREIEKEHLELNLCSIQESNSIHKEAIDYFCSLETGLNNDDLKSDLKYLCSTFTDAKEYGSILEVEKLNFEALKQRLKEIEQEENFTFGDYRKMLLDTLHTIIKQAEIMSKKYEVCVTNPPYLGYSGYNSKLACYLKEKYKNVYNDLYAVFISKCQSFTNRNNYTSMITQHSWMFIKSYEYIRKKIIDTTSLVSINHLGARAFEEIQGEVVQSSSFIIRKQNNKDYISKFVRLVNFNQSKKKEEEYSNLKNHYSIKQKEFQKIPTNPFAYWISQETINLFSECNNLRDIGKASEGVKTGNNELYLRLWHEIDSEKFSFGLNPLKYKWLPHHKGGEYRKWFGNNEWVINWENDGGEIKKSKNSGLQGKNMYFKKVITWSKVTSKDISLRMLPKNYLFDSGSPAYLCNKKAIEYIIGFLNSKIAAFILKTINPSINYQVGNIEVLPIKDTDNLNINELVNNNINLSKSDWNSFETSWDFKVHPLLKLLDKGEDYKLESIFNIWETECEENFNQLKANEEELNRIFIDIYGLEDELTPEVEDKDITIRKADRERDIKSLISYAVGCMFGRYSIDSEGLIYAGGEWEDKWTIDNGQLKVKTTLQTTEIETGKIKEYNINEEGHIVDGEKVEDNSLEVNDIWVPVSFMPDLDNVIPITEDEYFEDDIVSRFIDFVRTVYGEETLEENLDFIADSIGRKSSETARQAIRRYFVKDFYKDHLKVYQKRPIYWMFESGKNDGFKALVYMHRYNEQTVAKVRTDYLHTLQRKYEAEINRQQLIVDSEEYTAKDRTAAKKKIAKISKQIEECREYDQVVAHLANEKISIDLDDGVKVNYAKFQGVEFISSKGKEVKMNLLSKI